MPYPNVHHFGHLLGLIRLGIHKMSLIVVIFHLHSVVNGVVELSLYPFLREQYLMDFQYLDAYIKLEPLKFDLNIVSLFW